MLSDGVSTATAHADGLNAYSFVTTPPFKVDYSATKIQVDLQGFTGDTSLWDGGVLCEGQDLFTNLDENVAISQYQPSLTMKQDQYEIAQREGSYVPDSHLSARGVRIAGAIYGTDVVSCRTHFDNVMKSIIAWQTDEKRNLYLYEDRVAEVFLKKFDWSYKNGLKDIDFTLSMVIPDSTTRSIGKYRAKQTISGTITEFNVSYKGNALSLPVISFIADQGAAITTCTLENLTTGENFAYTGTVPTNVALDIDCDEGTVLNNGLDKIGQWSGDFLGLVRGTNYFRFSGSNCTIRVDYFERWM
jgi:phage-related protein